MRTTLPIPPSKKVLHDKVPSSAVVQYGRVTCAILEPSEASGYVVQARNATQRNAAVVAGVRGRL
jgi:hypothetical protein